ncbi:MAG: hypothetical protein AW09_001317 [Candidatus Accumulibacter phosphatis]|uniref:Uncharacterized protein n=1 Tax=Candidatus Accumulibacter phosphatis TaxID=327160 RepID=A0A080LXG2_9PROT|nr:MAG: hypothetical protein AW09_001317 [Candidatus Accumulibacter phosphatis]
MQIALGTQEAERIGHPVDGDVYPAVFVQFCRVALDFQTHRGLFVGRVAGLGQQEELLTGKRAIVGVRCSHLGGRCPTENAQQRKDQRDKKARR